MPRPKALLLENIHADAAQSLARAGFAVTCRPDAAAGDELRRLLRDVAVLGVRSRTPVSRAALEEAGGLLAVGCFCVGTDNIDLQACLDRGGAVFNAPYSNTRSVAELVIGEIIMLLRGVCDKSRRLHAGVWDKTSAAAREIRGKTLGIIGYGNIGGQVGLLAESLGMRVVYHDVVEKLSLGCAERAASASALLREADVVTIHVDNSPANAGLIGPSQLNLMKEGALLLNLSRGRIVDLAALAAALRRGHLGGAAVDVFPAEPAGNGAGFRSPLQGLPNVILTPHIGGSTAEAQKGIASYVADKLIDYMRSGDTRGSVNLPRVRLPAPRRCRRLLHIHRNVPGVLSQINRTLAAHGINVTGQYLETNARVGYAATDSARGFRRDVLGALERIPETIRLRVL